MPQISPSRVVQTSFSRGMFRSVAPELIPTDAAYDLLNLLLDEDGAAYKRGGSAYEATAPAGATNLTNIWSVYLTTGQKTIVADASKLYTVAAGACTAIASSSGVSAPARPVVMKGKLYLPGGETYDGTTIGTATVAAAHYATVASRLLAAEGDTIKFSAILDPTSFDPTDFHQLPGGVQIVGITGLRDAAVVFTTDGIYVIGNMAFNLSDDLGNAQQTLDRYSADLVLWGEAGIAGWSGSLVVPATDGVWLLSLGLEGEASQAFTKVSLPINDLYRSYVEQGCVPGLATVHRGHYILPILQFGSVVDVLVCRLDGQDSNGPTFPWSHVSGFSGESVAYATRLSGTASQLLAVNLKRPLRLHWFEPSGSTSLDADATAPEVILVTRDYPTGPLNKNTVRKVRLRYDLQPAGVPDPTIMASVGLSRFIGTEWGAFDWGEADWTSPSASFLVLDGAAPVDYGAVAPFPWRVGKKVEFARFLFRTLDEAAILSFRNIEVFVRDAGRV